MQTRVIMWIGMSISTVIYLVILLVVAPPPRAEPDPMMPILFGVLALGSVGASLVLPAKLTADALRGLGLATEGAPSFGDLPGGTLVFTDAAAARRRSGGALQTGFIIRAALTESVAIYGLVLGFLGYGLPVYIGFFAVAWVLFALAFPRQASEDAALEAAYGAKLR